MSLETLQLPLPENGPGIRRSVQLLRFLGAKPGPKAYIQAAVHADEIPALLVAQALRVALEALDAQGRIIGEILLVPYANPIGQSQFLQGRHMGRFELETGENFNRQYPDVFAAVCAAVRGRLGADPTANVTAIRDAIRKALAALPASHNENTALKRLLFGLAADADIVLDLHCEDEAIIHTYIGTPLWPQAADLAQCLGSRVNLLAEDSGGEAFDEANSRLWWRLAREFPDAAIPAACLAATVELRGERDVSDDYAAQDAAALVSFLAGRGFIVDYPTPEPAPAASASLLEAVDYLHCEHAGVVVWAEEVGANVQAGQVLGHVVDVHSGTRLPIAARTSGVFFARRAHRYARAGQWLAKIAGEQLLDWRKPGALLPN